MSIQPNYETYRYTDEIVRLQSQSIVECRLPASEIGGILSVQAKATPLDCTCVDGEARYNGRLVLCVIYEDADRKICRMERGAEFFHKAEDGHVTPACFAKASLETENISYRREGSGLYISVIVGADIFVYGSKQAEYLIGGENICAQTATVEMKKRVCISGETEGEDEFETDETGDILMHNARAIVASISAQAGEIAISGEMALGVCALVGESLRTYERIVPFTMQIPCEEAFGKIVSGAKVSVKNANLAVTLDEEKSKSKIVFSYTLSADCFLVATEEKTVVTDVFSPLAQIEEKRVNDGGRYLLRQIKHTERIGGLAALSPAIDGECSLQAALNPSVQISCKNTENGVEAEGVLTADILLKSTDGGYKACALQMPFVFPMPSMKKGEQAEIEALVCGLNLRRKKDGETEAEAILKLSARVYTDVSWEYIGGVEILEKWEETDCAVSIFALKAGEDLWQVAKRLKKDPKDLCASNPDLTFPVKEGARIFVYRQIK